MKLLDDISLFKRSDYELSELKTNVFSSPRKGFGKVEKQTQSVSHSTKAEGVRILRIRIVRDENRENCCVTCVTNQEFLLVKVSLSSSDCPNMRCSLAGTNFEPLEGLCKVGTLVTEKPYKLYSRINL